MAETLGGIVGNIVVIILAVGVILLSLFPVILLIRAFARLAIRTNQEVKVAAKAVTIGQRMRKDEAYRRRVERVVEVDGWRNVQ